MQPSDKCVVLLTGCGGEYDHRQVINMNVCDYKVVFPIPLNDPLTDAHHNLLLKTFSLNVSEAYQLLSAFPTTTTAHKDNLPAQPASIILSDQHCQYVNEHYLTASKNPTKALSLDQMAPERYKAYLLHSSEPWFGSVEVILDPRQILQDLNQILENQDYRYDYKNNKIQLSSETCLQIKILESKKKPFGPFDHFDKVVISLSNFLESIISNIRIPFVYHADTKLLEIIPRLYLDDGGVNFKPEKVCQDFVSMFKNQADFYYEAVIPRDAYLIWDASRTEMKFKLFDSRNSCQHQ